MKEWVEFVVKYWMQEVFGLIVLGLSVGYARLAKKFKKERQKNQAMETGMSAMLRLQIIDTYEKCVANGRTISLSRKDAIGDVYRSYVTLCQNQEAVDDTIKQLYEEMIRMPIM